MAFYLDQDHSCKFNQTSSVCSVLQKNFDAIRKFGSGLAKDLGKSSSTQSAIKNSWIQGLKLLR